VGWQPLPRPEQQRAFSYRLEKNEDYNQISGVQPYYFYQDREISERIYEYFDQGRALFPDDPASHLAAKAKRLTKFTKQQVDKAWNRLQEWNSCSIVSEIRQKMEKRMKIEYVQNPILSWDNTDVKKDDAYWDEKLKNVLANSYTRPSNYKY